MAEPARRASDHRYGPDGGSFRKVTTGQPKNLGSIARYVGNEQVHRGQLQREGLPARRRNLKNAAPFREVEPRSIGHQARLLLAVRRDLKRADDSRRRQRRAQHIRQRGNAQKRQCARRRRLPTARRARWDNRGPDVRGRWGSYSRAARGSRGP